MPALNYNPDGDTIAQFMASPAFVRGLRGPIGSGKSVACVVEMARLMCSQEKAIDPRTGKRTGRRKSRWGVIRNTTPQLETTTMKTWLEWLPEDEWGPVRWSAPYRQNIVVGDLDAEIWFLALDREEDVRKLLSFEFTGIWLNEARELSRHIVTNAISRVDRFPRVVDGGATRACVIMDTNAPDDEHWWAIMSGDAPVPDWMSKEDRLTLIKPDNWQFFTQPPAMFDKYDANGELVGYELNPDRENAKFTTEAYYTNLIAGQTRDWIRNMVQNQIGGIFSGRPVYTGFDERVHVAEGRIEPVQGEPLYVGIDFGLTPAAAFGQYIRGQVRTIDELVAKDMGSQRFARALKEKLTAEYEGFDVRLVGDPAGDDRAQTDEKTAYDMFKAEGLTVKASWSNDPLIRIGAVDTQLNTMVDGRPAYVVGANCKYLVSAKKGGYCYEKDGDKIDKKSIYSHVSDGEQYMMLEMGLGKKLINRNSGPLKVQQANTKQSLFNRGGGVTARAQRTHQMLSRGR